MNSVIAREKPGSGTAIRPIRRIPISDVVSRSTSVARRALGWSPTAVNSRVPRRSSPAIVVTASTTAWAVRAQRSSSSGAPELT
jgi:hypothetical protein